jgi:hypothetical protein
LEKAGRGWLYHQVAERLLQEAEDWLVDFYEEEGLFALDVSGEMKASFRASESLLRGDSSVILLATYTPVDEAKLQNWKLGSIVGLLRLVTLRTEVGRLPREARIEGTFADAPLERPGPRSLEIPELIWRPREIVPEGLRGSFGQKFSLDFVPEISRWEYSGVGELKNTVRDKATNLLDPMWAIGIGHGFLVRSSEALSSPLSTEARSVSSSYKGDRGSSRLGRVVLECDGEVRRKRFAQQGFRWERSFSNPQMPQSTTHWMKLDAEDRQGPTFSVFMQKWLAREHGSLTLRAASVYVP